MSSKLNLASTKLVHAKKNLHNALGDGMQKYYQLLKAWFKQKMTREDFDHEARKLLTPDSVHLHNQFILALLCKCQTLGSALAKPQINERSHIRTSHTASNQARTIKKRHKRSPSSTEKVSVNQFVEVNPLIMAPQILEQSVEQSDQGIIFSRREMALPDLGMLHGRLIVGAWENALDDVQDEALQILQRAVQVHLKNILTAVFSRRSGYKVREKRFKFAIGCDSAPTNLRNSTLIDHYEEESESTSVTIRGNHMPSIKPTVATAERDAAVMASMHCQSPQSKDKVTLHDLYNALQVHKSAIPCHEVYATNMERIINKMWLPSQDELMHDQLYRQDIKKRQERFAKHSASRI